VENIGPRSRRVTSTAALVSFTVMGGRSSNAVMGLEPDCTSAEVQPGWTEPRERCSMAILVDGSNRRSLGKELPCRMGK
jgi:hypothetical protein